MKYVHAFLIIIGLSGCAYTPLKNINATPKETVFPKPQGLDTEQFPVYQDLNFRDSEDYVNFNDCVDENLSINRLEEVVETCRIEHDIMRNTALLKFEEIRIEYLEKLTVKFYSDKVLFNKDMEKDFKRLREVFQNIMYSLETLKNRGIVDAEFLQGYLLVGSGVLLMELSPENTVAEAINHFDAAFHQGHEEAASVLISLYMDKESGLNYSLENALSTGEDAINQGMISAAITIFFTIHEPNTMSLVTIEDRKRLMSKIDALMYKASLTNEHKESALVYLAEKYWNGWSEQQDRKKAVKIYKELDVTRERFLERIQFLEKENLTN